MRLMYHIRKKESRWKISPGKGFGYDFYRISNDQFQKKVVYSTYLDLFISDMEEFSGTIICTGSDQEDINHSVYIINPIEQKIQRLFTLFQRFFRKHYQGCGASGTHILTYFHGDIYSTTRASAQSA
ncbi:MAG: hypothetical protein JXJ04_06480 [Spirochaetales bacterium]|nr:hypothetical protein [Spirochaetales bacterium]